jgi:nucleotide-binding universal stress UspA family protein
MKDYRHVLLAADVTQLAEELVARAADLARRYSAQLTCLYVLAHFPEEIP